MREHINKVKDWKHFLNENISNDIEINGFLYKVSDETIKSGDWVIWNNSNTVEKVKKVGIDLVTFEGEHRQGYIENCKKIIWTNNPNVEVTVKNI